MASSWLRWALVGGVMWFCLCVAAQSLQGSVTDTYHKLGIAQQTLYKEMFHTYELKLREEEQLMRELNSVLNGDGADTKGKSKAKSKARGTDDAPQGVAATEKVLIGKPVYVRKYISLELSVAAGLAMGLVGLLLGYSAGSLATPTLSK